MVLFVWCFGVCVFLPVLVCLCLCLSERAFCLRAAYVVKSSCCVWMSLTLSACPLSSSSAAGLLISADKIKLTNQTSAFISHLAVFLSFTLNMWVSQTFCALMRNISVNNLNCFLCQCKSHFMFSSEEEGEKQFLDSLHNFIASPLSHAPSHHNFMEINPVVFE